MVTARDDDTKADTALYQKLKAAGAPTSLVDFNTDHPFSDSRIGLQAAVIRWLQKLPGAPPS